MIKGIDTNERIEFISKHDHDEPKTVFIFRPLSGLEMSGLLKALEGGDSMTYLNETVFDIKDGIPEGGNKKDYLASLPLNILSELLTEANEINRLTGQDAKNC